jgi:hypothetical protein
MAEVAPFGNRGVLRDKAAARVSGFYGRGL